jgi:hypothetical protein
MVDNENVRIYPMRYYAIFLYTNNKQDYIMLFKPFENGLSHGVIVNLVKKAGKHTFDHQRCRATNVLINNKEISMVSPDFRGRHILSMEL